MAQSSYPMRPASSYPSSYPSPYPPGYRRPEPQYLMNVPPRRASFWRDIYNGAVLGDFAREKRFGGAFTQIVLGFTPGVGTICAARDCVADLSHRDALGFVLNLLALVPVFGGFSKTLDVLISLWHAHHVLRSRRRAQPQQRYVPLSAVPTQPLPQQRGRRKPQPRLPAPPQSRPYPVVGSRR